MNSIVLRVILFYVGSVFFVVALQPWNSPAVKASPYAAALSVLGVPAVATVMNILILTAVLSALNSALFTSSRMLFALTRSGDAPRSFARVSGAGVPRRAILAGTVLGWVSVVVAYLSPDVVFPFLINSYGAIALFVYVVIALSQIRLRRRADARGETPVVKMWLFPWLSWITVTALVVIVAAMAFLPGTRPQLLVSLLTLALVLALYEVRRVRGPRVDAENPAAAPPRNG